MSSVLLAEDSATMRFLLTRAFEAEGLRVFAVESGMEVLAAARTHRPSVIVLNIGLPGRDGLKVLADLRSDHNLSHTPVMMLTDAKQREVVESSLRGGADDFVVKPFDAAAVAQRVGALVSRRV